MVVFLAFGLVPPTLTTDINPRQMGQQHDENGWAGMVFSGLWAFAADPDFTL